MIKKTLFLLLSLISINAIAQFGIRAGVNTTNLDGNSQDASKAELLYHTGLFMITSLMKR